MQAASSIVQAIASVVNLVIVVCFFVIERKALSRDAKNERSEYWYRKTVLSRGLDDIEKCFDELEILVLEVDRLHPYNPYSDYEENVRIIIGKVQKQISLMKKILGIYTKLFDKSLSNDVKVLFENMEDSLTGLIEENFWACSKNEKVFYELTNFKYKIYNCLYKYDTRKK